MKRVYLFLGAVFLLMNTASLFAYQNEVKIDVWRTSSYEDYCDYEDVDFYLRASQDCYIAVLLVDPDGYANMIYPRPEMPQYRLRHGHRYRLSELMRDDPLYFYGMDGDAFITVIASRAPVYVDRWFIDEFTSFIEYEYGPSITIDLQFGHGFRVAWHKHLLHRGYGVVSVPLWCTIIITHVVPFIINHTNRLFIGKVAGSIAHQNLCLLKNGIMTDEIR